MLLVGACFTGALFCSVEGHFCTKADISITLLLSLGEVVTVLLFRRVFFPFSEKLKQKRLAFRRCKQRNMLHFFIK